MGIGLKEVKNDKTMAVRKTSVFPTSKETVFEKLQQLKTLQYIAYPYATFTPVDGIGDRKWEAGSKNEFQFKLFALLPLGIHNIKVIRFSIDEGIYTEESNHFVPVWNHEIVLEELDGEHTKYTDIVVIDAGWKTIFVYCWAVCFYTHRQRKWLKLLRSEMR